MSKKLNDLINSTNTIIIENLKKLFENFTVINKFQEDNNDNEFDIFFCKINIYFRNFIEQIKLKYIKELEIYEKKIEENNKDILELMMENMLLKIEKNSIESHQTINKEKIKNNKDCLIHSLLKVEFNNNNNYCNINTKTNFYNTGSHKKSCGSQENNKKDAKKKLSKSKNKNYQSIINNETNNLNEFFLMNKIEGIDSNNSNNQDSICHERNLKSIFTEPNYDNNEKSDNYYFIKKIKKEMNEILNKNNETKNNIPICYNYIKKNANEINKWNKKKKKIDTPKNIKKNFYKGLSEINFSAETPTELFINNDNNNFSNYKKTNINNINTKISTKAANTSLLNIYNKYNITKKILFHSKGKKNDSKRVNNSSNIVNNSMNNNESNISNLKLKTKTRNNFNSIYYLFNNNRNNYTTTIAASDVLQDNNIKNNYMTNNSNNNGFNSYINQSQTYNLNKKSHTNNNKITHNYLNQKKYFDLNNKVNKYKCIAK